MFAQVAHAHVIQELPSTYDIVDDAEAPLMSIILVAPYIALFGIMMGLIGWYVVSSVRSRCRS